MKNSKTAKTAANVLALMLALGIFAIVGLLYIRQQDADNKVSPIQQSHVPQAIATSTPPALAQAINTPQATAFHTQAPVPTGTAGIQTQTTWSTAVIVAQATTQVQGPGQTQATVKPQVTTQPQVPPTSVVAATSVAPPTTILSSPGGPTSVPNNPVPTEAAAGGSVPEKPPHSVPGTGGADPDLNPTPRPLLPAGQPAGGHADGSASVNTQQPTPKLPPAAPTPTIVTVKSTPKPKPGQVVLPNGVIYGERKPNLPNRIVRIASPNIKLDTSVYEVYSPKGVWEVADYAAGHNYNSKNPGEGGNIVMAGHNNWHGEVFRYLVDLKPGDTIKLWTLEGKEYHYTVQSVNKVLEAGASYAQRLKNAQVMDPTPNEQLTLITCWPYTTFTHRVIIVAKPSP